MLKDAGIEGVFGLMMLAGLCARVCWYVTLPIIFHRLNVSYVQVYNNLNMLTSQTDFAPYATTCGDPTYALNIDKANSYMLSASENISKAWAFTVAALVLTFGEPAIFCIGAMLIKCLGNRASKGTEIAYEKSNEVLIDYTGA